MTDTFEEGFYEKERVKAAPKVLGGNTSPWVGEVTTEFFQAMETKSVKTLKRICQLL